MLHAKRAVVVSFDITTTIGPDLPFILVTSAQQMFECQDGEVF
jgi:hypothetical protein